MALRFPIENYKVRELNYKGESLIIRAFERIPYVQYPVAPEYQVLNLYVPEIYYKETEEKIDRKYDLHSAPIFMPNTVGGYMPGRAGVPEIFENGEGNSIVKALYHGYVVVASGLRGRCMTNEAGEHIGIAPSDICDYKAVVRYLRYNKDLIAGNTERIISNGTSAGGAMSALLGATGNHPDYEEILEEMGAAKERDDIFFASCYCPIINLDHADMAYEWEFDGIKECHQMRYIPPKDKETNGTWQSVICSMSEEQIQWSKQLKELFPAYVEQLQLKNERGQLLSLIKESEEPWILIQEEASSLLELVCIYVAKSAEEAIKKGKDLSELTWLKLENGKVVAINYRAYITYRTRMKDTPAFDKVWLGTPENELFGNKTIFQRHFTEFSTECAKCTQTGAKENKEHSMAEAIQIKQMNPMYYIDDEKATKATYFHIRHGVIDRDTSLFIPLMFATKLKNQGISTDLAFPWETGHSGDYDLEEVFEFIDNMERK